MPCKLGWNGQKLPDYASSCRERYSMFSSSIKHINWWQQYSYFLIKFSVQRRPLETSVMLTVYLSVLRCSDWLPSASSWKWRGLTSAYICVPTLPFAVSLERVRSPSLLDLIWLPSRRVRSTVSHSQCTSIDFAIWHVRAVASVCAFTEDRVVILN